MNCFLYLHLHLVWTMPSSFFISSSVTFQFAFPYISTLLQPEVTSATVDFKKASAVVWTTDEAKGTQDWQKQYGEKLAKHLGTCGFESRLQGNGCISFFSQL